MNKKGFTLVELIAVIVLIALVGMLAFPSLKNLRQNNNEKQFTTYKKLMEEYTKLIPNYQNSSYICLDTLKSYGLKDINSNMVCNGYVIIQDKNLLEPFLSCSQNDEKQYESDDYDSSKCL